MVGAWPDRPRVATCESGCLCTGPGVEHTFASGRAAILECLRLAGLGADAVVATPECVTGCVAASVRRRGRPIPLLEALANPSVNLGAVIVYEQWGWPLPAVAEEAVRSRLRRVPVLVDRVDSADFLCSPRSFGAFEILSLSKVLGLDAGGLARDCQQGTYLRPRQVAPRVQQPKLLTHPAVRELFKQSDRVHPAVLGWLDGNCIVAGVEAERRARATAARMVLQSSLAVSWPDWMPAALDSGAGPVWAPVLRGSRPAVHWRALRTLTRDWGVTASIRMFNWTGNPLSPCYEAAVALPIHSGVTQAADIVSALEREVSLGW